MYNTSSYGRGAWEGRGSRAPIMEQSDMRFIKTCPRNGFGK